MLEGIVEFKKYRLADSEYIMPFKDVGMSNSELARRLGVSEGTIRYRLKRIRSGAKDRRSQRKSSISLFSDLIDTWVKENGEKRRRSTMKSFYGTLVNYHGCRSSYDAFRRYIRKHHPELLAKGVCIRTETPPGQLGLVDWKESIPVRLGRWENLVSVNFLMVELGFSRKPVVVVSERRDQAAFERCHAQAFEKLGGVPAWVRPDCVSTAVVKWQGRRSTLTESYRRFLGAYDVMVFPSRPGTPEDKGKVEKRIQDLFGRLDITNRVFTDLVDLQKAIDREIETLELEWRSGATGLSVAKSFDYERSYLKPLPANRPQVPEREQKATVRRDGTAFFMGNYYQVPQRLVGKQVLCVHAGCEITVWYDGEKIGAWNYLPTTKGLVALSAEVLTSTRIPISDTVRHWGLEVAARQTEIYETIIAGAGR
jgi:transposase